MDNNKRNKGSLLTKFLQVFLISVVIFSLIVGIATGGYVLLNKSKLAKKGNLTNVPTDPDIPTKPGEDKSPVKKERQFSTFAIFGVDKDGYRTDVTMILSFNHKTKQVDIVSIPRDTKITLPTDIFNDMKSNRNDTPKTLRINGVPAYAEKEKRNEYSVKVLEELFNIDIDYYVNMNLDSFRTVVDIIGPIEVDIPFDMVYNDPIQELYINLKKGKQPLNGAQAEQLIRYRKGYGNGDIGRINMQHEFMKAFMNELLTDKNKLNIINIATTIVSNVKTDFYDLLDYVPYINDISIDKLNLHNLPGTTKEDGLGFFYYDEAASKQLFDSIYQIIEETEIENNDENDTSSTEEVTEPPKETEPQKPEIISSKGLKIEVLNSTKITGLAGKKKKKLEENGFTVTRVGNYREESLKKTKIIIPNEGMGEDLSAFFKDCIIDLKPEELTNGVDIRIIIGSDDSE